MLTGNMNAIRPERWMKKNSLNGSTTYDPSGDNPRARQKRVLFFVKDDIMSQTFKSIKGLSPKGDSLESIYKCNEFIKGFVGCFPI